jgi:hypothetical protein
MEMKKMEKPMLYGACMLLLTALVFLPGVALATETCIYPNTTEAQACGGYVDLNTDGRCDNAADPITGAVAQQASLNTVAIIGVFSGIAGLVAWDFGRRRR